VRRGRGGKKRGKIIGGREGGSRFSFAASQQGKGRKRGLPPFPTKWWEGTKQGGGEIKKSSEGKERRATTILSSFPTKRREVENMPPLEGKKKGGKGMFRFPALKKREKPGNKIVGEEGGGEERSFAYLIFQKRKQSREQWRGGERLDPLFVSQVRKGCTRKLFFVLAEKGSGEKG